jgi:hypothetical protein
MQMVVQWLRELPTLDILGFLPKVCGPFLAALAVRATVMRPLAYRGRHSTICQWITSLVIAKSAGSGEPVFFIDRYCTYRIALRRVIFKRKKGFATIALVKPNLPFHGLTSTTISCHCPFKLSKVNNNFFDYLFKPFILKLAKTFSSLL